MKLIWALSQHARLVMTGGWGWIRLPCKSSVSIAVGAEGKSYSTAKRCLIVLLRPTKQSLGEMKRRLCIMALAPQIQL